MIDKLQREEARWRILATLNAGRPTSVTETLLHRVCNDLQLPLSQLDIRRELDYLASRKLVSVNKTQQVWLAELTYVGVDVVEYTVPCEPGIARPPQD